MGFTLNMKYLALVLWLQMSCVSTSPCPEEGCSSETTEKEKSDLETSHPSEVSEKAQESEGKDLKGSIHEVGSGHSSKEGGSAPKEEFLSLIRRAFYGTHLLKRLQTRS